MEMLVVFIFLSHCFCAVMHAVVISIPPLQTKRLVVGDTRLLCVYDTVDDFQFFKMAESRSCKLDNIFTVC